MHMYTYACVGKHIIYNGEKEIFGDLKNNYILLIIFIFNLRLADCNNGRGIKPAKMDDFPSGHLQIRV